MNQDMLKRLAEMQEQIAKAQEEIESRVAKGTAGGGAVEVEITGGYKVQSVHIEPDVVDPDDMSMLEDLVLAAVNEALSQVQAFHTEGMGGAVPDLGGLGIPGLGGPGGGGGGATPPLNRAARRANKR
jgi:DNA-binding YbaB/EbfC family protein